MLLQKTLLNIEGLGRQLDPELDLWKTAKPFLERWMDEPDRLARAAAAPAGRGALPRRGAAGAAAARCTSACSRPARPSDAAIAELAAAQRARNRWLARARGAAGGADRLSLLGAAGLSRRDTLLDAMPRARARVFSTR